jgi:ankyrin repeat protein
MLAALNVASSPAPPTGHEQCVQALLDWAIAQKGVGATAAVIDHVAPLRVASDAKRPGTALSAAIGNGHLAVARRLLEGGASASTADATGWTPLHYAARASSHAAVRLLLSAGGNARAATPTRFFFLGARTPLDVLGAGEDAIEAGQALLEALHADEL